MLGKLALENFKKKIDYFFKHVTFYSLLAQFMFNLSVSKQNINMLVAFTESSYQIIILNFCISEHSQLNKNDHNCTSYYFFLKINLNFSWFYPGLFGNKDTDLVFVIHLRSRNSGNLDSNLKKIMLRYL